MSDLKTLDKQILEALFKMESGYVLDFSDRTIGEFFQDELEIDFFDERYNYASGSKANRMRGFWREGNNAIVGKSIIKLIEYIENKIILDNFKQKDYPEKRILAAKKIADKLLTGHAKIKDVTVKADIVKDRKSVV